MEKLHELKRPAVNITVYKSHVELSDRSGCLGFLTPKNTTIPIRNISAVDITPMTETLVIKTLDGKSYKYSLGGLGGAAKGVRDAIFTAMQ
jgi:hypothetical protein